jgi:methyl-accepting chemotaxis protein
VNVAVTQLDQMTQQNAALVEESAAAAESLKDQAVRLDKVVRVFHTGDPGSTALVAPAAAAPVLTSVVDPAPAVQRPTTAPAPAKAVAPQPSPLSPEKRVADTPSVRPAPVTASASSEGDWESF